MPADDEERPDRRYPANRSWRRVENRPEIVFVTVCAKDRRPILATEAIQDFLLAAWRAADTWVIGRYVILPDHVHLFASPNGIEAPSVRTWVRFWKSNATRQWPGTEPRPIWQRDLWDRQLRYGDSYAAKWEYVRANPVRHGLVNHPEDWPYQGEVGELPWHE